MENIIDDDWEDPRTEELPEQEPAQSLRYEIMNYPADTTLEGYADMWGKGELAVPDFQRQFIWDRVKSSKLIESFLLGLPVPGIFLFKERNSAQYQIIDGHQRVGSIVSFMKGIFGDKAFRLKNVDSRWDGKTFEELSDDDKFTLEKAVLRATIIQQLDPDDHSSIYLIFERLNTGGVNLNPMEVRQCVSYGDFVKELRELNKDGHWRLLIGKPQPDKRLRDVELILRCLALIENHEQYEKPMKGFLNDYMEMERENPSNYPELRENFGRACKNIFHQLGEKPFHFRGRLNYGVLDSVMTTEMKFGPLKRVKSRLAKLQKEEDYIHAVTINTSDAAELNTRLELAMKYLMGE